MITLIRSLGSITAIEYYQNGLNIGYQARDSELSFDYFFPHSLRTVPAHFHDAQVLFHFGLEQFGWNRVVVITTNDLFGSAVEMVITQDISTTANAKLISVHKFDSGSHDFSDLVIKLIKEGGNIFILALKDVNDAIHFMKQGVDLGLFIDGTQILGNQLISEAKIWTENGYNLSYARDALKGFIGIQYQDMIYIIQITNLVNLLINFANWKVLCQQMGNVMKSMMTQDIRYSLLILLMKTVSLNQYVSD